MSHVASNQLEELRRLVATLRESNAFYGEKLRAAGIDASVDSLDVFFERMPFTTKQELTDDQEAQPPYGTNLTFELSAYTRFHQTSGTTRRPMRWLDTNASWQWMLDCWKRVFAASGVDASDRVMFAFSFGPFLGFWTAFESALQVGCLCLPGGALSSEARLQLMREAEATVLCCTPTYAIRLGQHAASQGGALKLNSIIVAGEPGASVDATRQEIARLWGGARVCDHHGMTETGPVTYPSPNGTPNVLHVIESAYVAEVIDPETQAHAESGKVGELVLTNLGRTGMPLLRYRTGDLVRAGQRDEAKYGTADLPLVGGILSRADDMLLVRGVNVFPSAVEQVIRSVSDVAEFRVRVSEQRGMTELQIEVEPTPQRAGDGAIAEAVAARFRDAFNLRVPVTLAAVDELPRFEMKAKRWVRSTEG